MKVKNGIKSEENFTEKINKFTNNINNNITNNVLIIKKSNEKLVNFQTLSEKKINFLSFYNIFTSTIYIIVIAICLFIIYLILTSKIYIMFSKILNNICGRHCGYLTFRSSNDKLSLDNISFFLSNFTGSKFFNIKFDLIFVTFIFIFRMLTAKKAFQIKGISFMWKIFKSPEKDQECRYIFLTFCVILYTTIVVLYDFAFLIPDYLRFNGLNKKCDYSNIDKDYCGTSFFGLIFLKISMNFWLFMYFDIIAAIIFLVNGTLFFYRLILNPLWNILYLKYIEEFRNEKKWKLEKI
jgi:hypothetical protein